MQERLRVQTWGRSQVFIRSGMEKSLRCSYSRASLVTQTLSRIWLPCRRPGFYPWVGKIPWRREWLPTPVFLPGEFHRQRSTGATFLWVAKSQTLLSTDWVGVGESMDWSIHTLIHTIEWLDNSRKKGTTAPRVTVNESNNRNIGQKKVDTKQALLCASVHMQFKARRHWSEGSEVRIMGTSGEEREGGD